MTPKERVTAILNRQPVDRLPVDIWYTPEIQRDLIAHTGANSEMEMWTALGLDKIAIIAVGYTFGSGTSKNVVGTPASENRTMWGVPLREIKSGSASYNEILTPPMEDMEEVEELDDYPYWPDPDKFDYTAAVESTKAASQKFCTIGPWVSFYEIYCQLRGLEQAMIDLAMEPEFVEACLDRIEAIQTKMMKRYFDQAAPYLDLVFISDDIGGQNGLLFSPAMWQQHLQPRMKRWCDLVHSYGMKVLYHSDGGLEPLIQPLIDCGIDVLNPIQHICPGMDTAHLKQKFGEQVLFHGGIDTQKALPFGTPEDVRKETRHCMDTLGSDGAGYIVASCHNVQAGTPMENILAMIETVTGG
jgi:uroporphyrinogen decarboxylase